MFISTLGAESTALPVSTVPNFEELLGGSRLNILGEHDEQRGDFSTECTASYFTILVT